MRRLAPLAWLLVASACTVGAGAEGPDDPAPATTTLPPLTTLAPIATTTTSTTVAPSAPTTTTAAPTVATPATLTGRVLTPEGAPLFDAVVTVSGVAAVTDAEGRFTLEAVPGEVAVTRPGWHPVTRTWPADGEVEVTMHPRVIRAIRITNYAARDDAEVRRILRLAADSSVNAVVFDAKDETAKVHYPTRVEEAAAIGALEVTYDLGARIAEAKAEGLYTIVRVVSFEDSIRSRERPELRLALAWLDPAIPESQAYPLALAEEVCDLGADEVQFDYVRYPTGRSATLARNRRPATMEERVAVIAGFLAEAMERLHAKGCAVSADIFGIVLSSPDDQGIGQRPEEISAVTDAISPMLYPSHYSPGWLGFPDPNDFPGPVIADALNSGAPRMVPTGIMRPWLQAFYYSPAQIHAEIAEAEARGMGWILWNAAGNYQPSWLPPDAVAEAHGLGAR